MNDRFTFRFYGRLVGALGVKGWHVQTVEAATHDAAILALYATHEHISNARLLRRERGEA